MSDRPIRLGTRGSALARWQADWVAQQLAAAGAAVEMVLISTRGDREAGAIGVLGGQGVFTKEIQQALLEKRVDLAVHSLKDLPTDRTPGLRLAATPARQRAGDALLCRQASSLQKLPRQAVVGTGSLRRQAQLLHARPDLQMKDIRGNVDTRLRKLADGKYDAIVLAEAGLLRLDLADHITERLDYQLVLPAVGQGALGLEVRDDDQRTQQAVAPLNDDWTMAAVTAERALLRALRGGCLAPVGAWAREEHQQLALDAVVLSSDGSARLAVRLAGPPADAAHLGRHAARQLLDQGAAELIAAARGEG